MQLGLVAVASADTLEAALAYAYVNNPQINAQRALVRATDEGVPTALAGYRPKAAVTANAGFQTLSTTIREIGSTTPIGAPASYFTQSGTSGPYTDKSGRRPQSRGLWWGVTCWDSGGNA